MNRNALYILLPLLLSCNERVDSISTKSSTVIKAKTIVGTSDDRKRVYSHRTKDRELTIKVGHILSKFKNSSKAKCSGTTLANDFILTAAHCVYSKKKGFAKTIEYHPGAIDENVFTFSRHFIDKIWIKKDYIKYAPKDPRNVSDIVMQNDIALLRIKRYPNKYSLSNVTGHFEVGSSPHQKSMQEVKVLSYPKDKIYKSLWDSGKCKAWHFINNLYQSDCDIMRGSSGAGLLTKNEDGNWVVQGVFVAEEYNANDVNIIDNEVASQIDQIISLKKSETQDFQLQEISENPYNTVYLKNKCRKALTVALSYKNTYGNQKNTKPILLKARETKKVFITKDQGFLIYASDYQTKKKLTSGKHTAYIEKLGMVNLEKRKIKKNWSDHLEEITCE